MAPRPGQIAKRLNVQLLAEIPLDGENEFSVDLKGLLVKEQGSILFPYVGVDIFGVRDIFFSEFDFDQTTVRPTISSVYGTGFLFRSPGDGINIESFSLSLGVREAASQAEFPEKYEITLISPTITVTELASNLSQHTYSINYPGQFTPQVEGVPSTAVYRNFDSNPLQEYILEASVASAPLTFAQYEGLAEVNLEYRLRIKENDQILNDVISRLETQVEGYSRLAKLAEVASVAQAAKRFAKISDNLKDQSSNAFEKIELAYHFFANEQYFDLINTLQIVELGDKTRSKVENLADQVSGGVFDVQALAFDQLQEEFSKRGFLGSNFGAVDAINPFFWIASTYYSLAAVAYSILNDPPRFDYDVVFDRQEFSLSDEVTALASDVDSRFADMISSAFRLIDLYEGYLLTYERLQGAIFDEDGSARNLQESKLIELVDLINSEEFSFFESSNYFIPSAEAEIDDLLDALSEEETSLEEYLSTLSSTSADFQAYMSDVGINVEIDRIVSSLEALEGRANLIDEISADFEGFSEPLTFSENVLIAHGGPSRSVVYGGQGDETFLVSVGPELFELIERLNADFEDGLFLLQEEGLKTVEFVENEGFEAIFEVAEGYLLGPEITLKVVRYSDGQSVSIPLRGVDQAFVRNTYGELTSVAMANSDMDVVNAAFVTGGVDIVSTSPGAHVLGSIFDDVVWARQFASVELFDGNDVFKRVNETLSTSEFLPAQSGSLIDGGDGNDVLLVRNTPVENVLGGDGNDHIDVGGYFERLEDWENSRFGTLQKLPEVIDAGNGDDYVRVSVSTKNDTVIRTGAGNDYVDLGLNGFEDAAVRTVEITFSDMVGSTKAVFSHWEDVLLRLVSDGLPFQKVTVGSEFTGLAGEVLFDVQTSQNTVTQKLGSFETTGQDGSTGGQSIEYSQVISYDLDGNGVSDGDILILDPRGQVVELASIVVNGDGKIEVSSDDSIPAVFEISQNGVSSVLEGDTGPTDLRFTVLRSGNVLSSQELNWTVELGSASADDFSGALVSGSIQFEPGQLSSELEISINGDTIPESDEAFRIIFSDPENGEKVAESGFVTIFNDDKVNTRPSLDVPRDLLVVEGTTNITKLIATDAELDRLEFSISGGADAALFSLSLQGDLSFMDSPDFEDPIDQGGVAGDNTYELEVTVSDGVLKDTRLLTVSVANDVADDRSPTVVKRQVFEDGRAREVTCVDGVRSFAQTIDVADVFEWAMHEGTYNYNGDLEKHTIFYDDGRIREVTFADDVITSALTTDAADFFEWATHTGTYNNDGDLEKHTIFYDDGRIREVAFGDDLLIA